MKRVAPLTALGVLTVVSCLAIPASASAQSNKTWARWQNADTSRGVFYLSVWGGEVCDPNIGCGLGDNTKIVTYQLAGNDQVWAATYDAPGIPATIDDVQNWFKDYRNEPHLLCLATGGNNSTAAGAGLVVYDCQDESQGPGQYWQIVSAEDLGAPYSGCYAFINQHGNDYVMSVRNGLVQNGSEVDQYPLCRPNTGACGNPSYAWHPDQFWCPVLY